MIGVVDPPIGIVTKPIGTPAAANTSPASSVPSSCPSGVTVPSSAEIGEARRTACSPPATTRAISTATMACSRSTIVTVWTCLPVFAITS